MLQQIPVFRTVGRAFNGVFASVGELAPKAAGPLLVSITLALLREYLFEPRELFLIPAQVYSAVSTLPVALFALTCHRACLGELGLGSAEPGREQGIAFVLWSVFLVVLLTLPEVVAPTLEFGPSGELAESDGAASALNLALVVGTIIVSVRWCLILPATAAGERSSLGAAWLRSRGNSWRLFWACSMAPCLVLLPALIVFQLNGLLPVPSQDPASTLSRFAVNATLLLPTYLAAALGAFALCHAYASVRSNGPTAQHQV